MLVALRAIRQTRSPALWCPTGTALGCAAPPSRRPVLNGNPGATGP
jgi:hypothetical protein